jgi:HAD superfamily hydrolase (TIGR01549 family)
MTAASHNRFIYFKQLCKAEGLPLCLVQITNQNYWQHFYSNMVPFEGARSMLKRLRQLKVRIAILSDFQIEHQFEKLRRLDLLDLVDDVITSEEVGIEKPNSKMFLTALARIGASAERAIMIGDSVSKDMIGASRCGIHGVLISKNCDQTLPKNCQAFPDVQALDKWLSEISLAVDELVELSRICGMRFDLTQAAGGNISVKYGSHMLIKSSGIHLADVERGQGYSVVDNDRLLTDLALGPSPRLEHYVQFSTRRPSIETFMHAGLARYTVHLHPIQANTILTATGARDVITEMFPDAEVIDYITPGLKLAAVIKRNHGPEQVIFLLSHGVVFSTTEYAGMLPLIEKTLARFNNTEAVASLRIADHARVNPLAKSIERYTGTACTVYLSEDAVIAARLSGLQDMRHCFPDAVVYCGDAVLYMQEPDEITIQQFIHDHGIPKLIVIQERLYIADISLRKCRDVEAVIKSVLLLQDSSRDKEFLDADEVKFLHNWDAETYRKQLKA